MGTLSHERPVVNDLKVTIHRSSILFPSLEIPTHSMFLSNIDQVLNFDVETIHFFQASPLFPPEKVVDKLENALSRLLVHYDFLAGRLKFNPEQGRLEIDCNAAGAEFSVASSELSLEQTGDLAFPNPAFQQLIVRKSEKLGLEDKPLICFQVTTFRCGGFAIGISNNHTTFDGISFKMFLENLAAVANDSPLPIPPCNNRRLLSARSPPRVAFSHPELVQIKLPAKGEEAQEASILNVARSDLELKVFRLSGDHIAGLKEKAKAEGGSGPAVTGFNVVTAHLWRCKMLAMSTNGVDPEKALTVLYAIDLRPRLQPPLPKSYTGNAVLTGYGSATHRELEEGPFLGVVEAVRQGATRMTDEYARSVIDWGEVYKGFPRGDVVISSWWRLGFADVEYPWGKPIYGCPVMIPHSDIIVLVPDEKGTNGNGVNAFVALPSQNMENFERLFYKFLA